jgi:cytosine/adenosine deaminase-related metal-dependent hydrolase
MGHPIAFKAKRHGCSASIGIDVCSNNPADMFQQMRLLLQGERHRQNEASDLPLPGVAQRCEEVLRMATMGGAEAVGLQDVIGSITPGKRADLIITRCDSTRLSPILDPVGALVLYANGSDIDTVMIDGVVVKSKYALTVVDWPTVRCELRKSHDAIMTRAKNAPSEKLKQRAEGIVGGTSLDPEKFNPRVE